MKRIVIIAVLAVVAIVGAAVVFHAASSSDSSSRRAAIGSGTPTAADGQFTMASMAGSPLLNGAAIKVSDWTWEVESATTIGSGATGGATVGKTKFNDFTVSKNIDNASTTLFTNMTKGTPVILTFKVGPLTYVFSQAFVTKIEQSGSGGDGNEQVSFAYASVKTTNSVPGSNPPSACWSQVTNAQC